MIPNFWKCQESPPTHLLLPCVQPQCLDKARRVDVAPLAVLQQSKQVLQVFTDGLGLIVWEKHKTQQEFRVRRDHSKCFTTTKNDGVGR